MAAAGRSVEPEQTRQRGDRSESTLRTSDRRDRSRAETRDCVSAKTLERRSALIRNEINHDLDLGRATRDLNTDHLGARVVAVVQVERKRSCGIGL